MQRRAGHSPSGGRPFNEICCRWEFFFLGAGVGDLLTSLDVVVFVGSLLAVMGMGLWAGRNEATSEDYYLAGRNTSWWGVAASIFGSNVSANHIVGMMGIGFSIGFAQSHFEISAIAGLLVMCYAFLPIYRRLQVYTLSEYLEKRYNDQCRLIYAIIMVIVMVVIQMVPAFYIGSRSVNILLQGGPGEINQTHYVIGIVVMAIISGSYTILGGLKAVILTDTLQSILMLIAGLVVAYLTFSQPEIGGWNGMAELDAMGAEKLHLYRPSDHPDLPWSGVLFGLIILHFNYWGTNQFIVQRAISARSDADARIGIIAAGFLKLMIPFYSVGAGIAAFYFLQARDMEVAPDAVFTTMLAELVAPVGYGLMGIVAAGLLGAILSSIDSMMNSAATIVTFDIYRRYFRPDASERSLILFGRCCILVFVIGGALITILSMDPNSQENFFLQLSKYQSKFVVGVVVAFLLGMLWPRATPAGGTAAIVSGAIFGFAIPWLYDTYLISIPALEEAFGTKLNFMHTAFANFVLASLVHVGVSLATKMDPEKSKMTWIGLGIFTPTALRRFGVLLTVTVAVYFWLGLAMVRAQLLPGQAGSIAALWTFAMFWLGATRSAETGSGASRRDLILAGLLAGSAVWMLYYFA